MDKANIRRKLSKLRDSVVGINPYVSFGFRGFRLERDKVEFGDFIFGYMDRLNLPNSIGVNELHSNLLAHRDAVCFGSEESALNKIYANKENEFYNRDSVKSRGLRLDYVQVRAYRKVVDRTLRLIENNFRNDIRSAA